MKKTVIILSFLIFGISKGSAEPFSGIDYSKQYDCKYDVIKHEIDQDQVSSKKVTGETTTITFDVQKNYVFVETSSTSQEIRWTIDKQSGRPTAVPIGSPRVSSFPQYVVPNYNQCDGLFDVQEMVFDPDMIATGFQSVDCRKDRLASQYFVSYSLSPGSFVDVVIEMDLDGILMNTKEVQFSDYHPTVVTTKSYVCAVRQ